MPCGHPRGLSLELCAVICHISPMALYRLLCALGHHSMVTALTRCGLPLPTYVLADEKPSHCLTDKVYLPTIVRGRVIWHLGYTENASAAAFTQSYQEFQCAASQQEPSYRVRGILTDGFDSTIKSMRALFPGARLGNCLRHAINKLPGKLTAIASPVRKALRSQFHTLLYRCDKRKGLRVFALGQRLRRFGGPRRHHGWGARRRTRTALVPGEEAGWYAVLEDPRMPVTSTLLDQAHNAIDRKLFMMKAFHHPQGSQQAFSARAGPPVQPGPLPVSRQARRPMWCRSRRRQSPHTRLVAQSQVLTSGGFR